MPRLALLTLCAVLAAQSAPARAAVTLIESGNKTTWRYLDHDQRPPAEWFQSAFDDRAWSSGRAPLGFGAADVTTTVRFGPDANAKAPVTYFRHSFTAADPAAFASLRLHLRVDDAALIYLNGREVARHNLPAGSLGPRARASVAIGGEAEDLYHVLALPVSALVSGRNVLAVAVHQSDAASSDLFLDLKLLGYGAGEQPVPSDAPVAPAHSPDPAVAGPATLRSGNVRRALELLALIPDDHPRLQSILLQAGSLLAESFGRPADALPLVERAYRQAPDAQRTAYAWARTQLLARTNLVAPLVPRAHAREIPETWRWIVAGPNFPDRSKKFSRAQLEADLDYLETMIANGFSYADRLGVDWRPALDAVRASLEPETGVNTFAFRLTRFIAIFGDAHSGLRSPGITWPGGYLPFLPVPDAPPRVLALKPDRSGFIDATHPYVHALGGRPLDDWLRVAGWNQPHASPHLRWRGTVRELAWLNYLRGEMKLPATPEVSLTLASADGTSTRELTLPVASRRPRIERLADTHFVRDDIGCLRIQLMLSDEKFIAGLDAAMRDLRSTKGLIIDIRNNGGGTMHALRALLPYFLPPGGPLRVVGVARYRIPVTLEAAPREGFLPADRLLRPVTASVWSEEDRAQLRSFLSTFKPAWTPPNGTFSDWHLMAFRHESNPAAYAYRRPVVMLCDSDAASAADSFAAGFKGLPNVTLLGTTSAGMSGRMGDYLLPNTRLVVTLSQMVSYRANGKLIEGAGVEPDIELAPKPTDYLVSGGDSILEAAFARLTAPRPEAARASSQQQ